MENELRLGVGNDRRVAESWNLSAIKSGHVLLLLHACGVKRR